MSTETSQSAIQQAANILLQAKQDVNITLNENKHGMILIGVNSSLDSLINRLLFLGGGGVMPVVKQEFPPVTNFMGDELKLPKELSTEDLTPADEEKQTFVLKVDRLQAEFDTITPEGILNSYTLPEDVLVVRGVAKRAGVEGYEDREMNIQFIEDISKGLKQKVADDIEQQKIDEQLSAGQTKPLSRWTKAELQAELTKRGIEFEVDATNKTLVELLENDDAK